MDKKKIGVSLEEVFEDDDDTENIEGTEGASEDSTEEQIILAVNIKFVIILFLNFLICGWFLFNFY